MGPIVLKRESSTLELNQGDTHRETRLSLTPAHGDRMTWTEPGSVSHNFRIMLACGWRADMPGQPDFCKE